MHASQHSIQECLDFINHQLDDLARTGAMPRNPLPCVTLSREAGARGMPIAHRTVDMLNCHIETSTPRWTFFDKDLVQRVLADHRLPTRLEELLPEHRLKLIPGWMAGEEGGHPAEWRFFTDTPSAIRTLGMMGRCLVLGRGAHVATREFPTAFHVRLVGSLERRVAHVAQRDGISAEAAADWVKRADRERARFILANYNEHAEDAKGFHLVLNTDRISDAEAASIICQAALRRTSFERSV